MKIRSRSIAARALLALALVPLALAQSPGQSKAMTAEELAARSELIAVGKVKSLQPQWEGTRERIVTYVTMDVDQYLKGGSGPSLTIVSPGGEIDGVGEIYSHAARFQKDEDVVVFAERDGRGRYRLSGGVQGKFGVSRDEKTGKSVVAHYWTLDDFKGKVDRALKAQGRK